MIVIKYIGWKWYKRSDNITSSRRMDIVKAFNANDLHTEIVIKGTIDDPLLWIRKACRKYYWQHGKNARSDIFNREGIIQSAETITIKIEYKQRIIKDEYFLLFYYLLEGGV